MLVPDPNQPAVAAKFREWLIAGEECHAPAVMPAEVLNVLARQVWDSVITAAEAAASWTDFAALGIVVDSFDLTVDGPRSLEIAQALHRRHATDCTYVSLAERVGADVWTLDGGFARAAHAAGLRVRLVV